MIYRKNGRNKNKLKIQCSNRGKRSELMGFYCDWCRDMHEDYPYKEIHIIGDLMFCESGCKCLLKELR